MPNTKSPANPAPLPENLASKILVRGIHLELSESLRAAAIEKSARLLRHSDEIIRVRIDLEHDKTRDVEVQFVAKGHIEIAGPDLLASVASEDAYKSLDFLIDKLDGLLRRRHGLYKDRRHDAPAAVVAE